MKRSLMLLCIGLIIGFAAFSNAAPIIDVVEYNTEFFTPPGVTTGSPYYRWFNEDWGWKHTAIGGTFTTANLSISAYDVDYSVGPEGEHDIIYVKESGSWVKVGELAGSNNIWSYTTFSLGSQFFDEIAAGLEVRIDIDSTHTYNDWAVALAKSVLSLDGGQLPDPNPGSKVPEPGTLLLLGFGLIGIAGYGRKKLA
jgi:hypothetical protein